MLSREKIAFFMKPKRGFCLISFFMDKKGEAKFISINSFDAHAEIACINKFNTYALKKQMTQRKIKRFVSKHDLVVLRFTRQHLTLCCSKPCKFCAEQIKSMPFKNVFFVNSNSVIEKVKTRDLESDYITKYMRNQLSENFCPHKN